MMNDKGNFEKIIKYCLFLEWIERRNRLALLRNDNCSNCYKRLVKSHKNGNRTAEITDKVLNSFSPHHLLLIKTFEVSFLLLYSIQVLHATTQS